MMKKTIMLEVLMIIFASFVSAEITVTSPFNDKYNRGDSIDLKGYIIPDSNIAGMVYVNAECPGSVNLASRAID